MTTQFLGDKGQRFEISADGYPVEGKTNVIGWAEEYADAYRIMESISKAPGCERGRIRDRSGELGDIELSWTPARVMLELSSGDLGIFDLDEWLSQAPPWGDE